MRHDMARDLRHAVIFLGTITYIISYGMYPYALDT